MPQKSPQQVAQKWAQRVGASAESVRNGVQSVTQSPTELAARRKDAYVAGVTRAASDGKWERGLRRITLDMWKTSMLEKGVSRMASGAAAAVGKMEAFMAEWLPYEEQLRVKLASMPRGDLEQNIARANEAMRYNAAFRRRG